MKKISKQIADLESKLATDFNQYKKEHPGTKKTQSDPMFAKGAHHHKVTALWSSTDDDESPLDKHHSVDDIHHDTSAEMDKHWDDFAKKHKDMVDKYGEEEVAHDFWLTRNRHGAGFWDGDYDKEDGKLLTDAAHKAGEYHLYKGDDGKIHGMKG